MTDREYMLEALSEARLALAEGELPVGCIVVHNHEIIARAHNEREKTQDPTAHAEVVAMRRAANRLGSWRLNGCTLYVTLEPCPMCAGTISQARVSRLVYGAPDPSQGCAGSVYRIPEDPVFSHFCKSDGGVEEEACAAVLNEFFSGKRMKDA